MKSLSSPLARFWKEDVKIARDYAFTHDPEQSLGEEFIREWVVSCSLVELVPEFVTRNSHHRNRQV